MILVSEAKYQGKDIENIKRGILVGKNNNQDLMVAGNAIERAHKNIAEIANYMLSESHFPYVLFLEGSNLIYTHGNGERWDEQDIYAVMLDIAETSLKVLGSDLFCQLTKR